MTMLYCSEVNHLFELPLWYLPPDGDRARRRVYEHDLDQLDPEHLAPRAALMTGMLRLAACELFVAGTGAGGPDGYERVTDSWFEQWLGESVRSEAVVSATLRLPNADVHASEAERHALVWQAHHAAHNPALLGDRDLQTKKLELVRQIETERQSEGDASSLFREMHALLRNARATHGERLDAMIDRATDATMDAENQRLLADRTWAFPLFGDALIDGLAEQIRRRFASGAASNL